MKEVLGATEVGGKPPKVAPARDTSVTAQVYGAFPGPRLLAIYFTCEHCVTVLKGTPLHEKAGS